MRKKLTLKSVLLAAAMLVGGATSAWADKTVVGAEDNTTGWWSAFSKYYTIAPNKTLSIEFENYSDKALNYHNWLAVVSTAAERGAEGYSEYVVLRNDNYAWQYGLNTGPESSHDWYTSLSSNFAWDYDGQSNGQKFRDEMDGSTVVLTVKREYQTVTLHADITAKSGSTYFEEFVINCGTGSQDINVFLTTEAGHLVIDNDKETTTDTSLSGTLVGAWGNTTGWWGAHSAKQVLGENKSLHMEFTNFTSGVNNYNNWVLVLTDGLYPGEEGYGKEHEYAVLRADVAKWGSKDATSTYNLERVPAVPYDDEKTVDENQANYWGIFRSEMNAAKVVVDVVRWEKTITVTAVMTATNGSVWTEVYTNPSFVDDASQDIVAFFTVDNSCLVIDDTKTAITNTPLTKTISAAGWATLCCNYDLDFTSPIENLTAAYAITGNTGSRLTLTPISQVVAAGQGILLEGSGECKIPVGENGSAVAGNKLVGVLSETDEDAGIYVLMDGGNGVGFYQTTNTFTVGANTAYLPADAVSARAFYSFDDATTGIGASLNDNGEMTNDKPVYNLAGQRVSQPTKGLYIVGGKKVALR